MHSMLQEKLSLEMLADIAGCTSFHLMRLFKKNMGITPHACLTQLRLELAEAAILATTWSLWIVIFSSLILLRRPAPSILVSAITGFSGAALVIASGKELSFDSAHMKGYLPALCCGIIWSSFSVWLPRLQLKKDPMANFTILAALCSFVLYLINMPHHVPSDRAIFSALYLGLIPLGLSFFLWNRAINGGNMVVIGFLSYLTPPLAVLLVALVHKESIAPQVLAGMAMIIAASILGKYFLGIALSKN